MSNFTKLIDENFHVDGYKAIYENERKEMFDKILETLTDRERVVIINRFGLDGAKELTYDQIANRFGVTRERVRQIQMRAMKKLRHPTRSKKMQKFMEDLSK